MTGHSWELPDEAATAALATRMATALESGLVVYLHGDLGAGKTSFARALLGALGVGERIKSPTYSLVESYRAQAGRPGIWTCTASPIPANWNGWAWTRCPIPRHSCWWSGPSEVPAPCRRRT